VGILDKRLYSASGGVGGPEMHVLPSRLSSSHDRIRINLYAVRDEVSGSSPLVGSLTKARTQRDCREASWSLEGSLQPTLGAQDDPQQDFCNPPQPFLFLPLFKESCDTLIRGLEYTHAAVGTAAVKTSSTQPTRVATGGVRG
jgi:hypothetical protein